MTTRRLFTATLSAACAAAQQSFELRYKTHVIKSTHQQYDNPLRILEPSRKTGRVVYLLPVNPDISYRWGDGFDTAARSRLHEKHGVIIAAPAFSNYPWYGDHPQNAKIRQETYFINDVVPYVDKLFPGTKRLLAGFSKSGNGAVLLLLRHPELFHAAAAWDAPLMKLAPDEFGMAEVFGNTRHFARYCIPRLLESRAAEWQDKPARIALTGHGSFEAHMREAHELMVRLRVQHLYENSIKRVHRWDSGWLEEAFAALDKM
ncbi:MAG: hypothetical protein HYZ37_00125 [Candidatus Solibacter usitatus]|nr:hypothetical protein [Candidatus Solibacter usitatus]